MKLRFIKLFTITCLSLLFGACSIKQRVEPLPQATRLGQEIAVIPLTKGVRKNFKRAYHDALQRKGFIVKEYPPKTSPAAHPLSTTYIARWSWDTTIYMSYADIIVYKNGKQIGRATYDSRRGSMRIKKFINATEKLDELVDQLFPD